MLVTTVSYSELVSGDNYSNRTIGATAVVEPGEEPDAALSALRSWVQERHATEDETDTAIRIQKDQLNCLVQATNDESARLTVLRERYERAKAFLKECGIPALRRWDDEVPF